MRLQQRIAATAAIERYAPWRFGIPRLDQVTGGVRAGFLNLVAARPHVGKTHLVLCGIRNNPDVPTLFISADDNVEVVARKIVQFDGVVADGWKASVEQITAHLEANYPLLDVVDNVAWGPVQRRHQIGLADAIEQYLFAYGRPPELIVYDYFGVDGLDFSYVQECTAWAKQQALLLPMPMLVIAQSKRPEGAKSGGAYRDKDGNRHPFRMEELMFGGEQAAGLIMGLSPSQRGGRKVVEIDVVKNKAVFNGSGLTNVESPIVLHHAHGTLLDNEQYARVETYRDDPDSWQ